MRNRNEKLAKIGYVKEKQAAYVKKPTKKKQPTRKSTKK
jgi:hypothetical protein